MTKRVFIIHGWDGKPDEAWLPWLKKELEVKGFEVQVPEMPETETPKIGAWVGFLQKLVGEVDENTYFVGHSIGCQTILRYLQTLPDDKKVGGVVFVAGFVTLNMDTLKEEGEEALETAKPWLQMPLSWGKILTHTTKFVAIFSEDDPDVPRSNAAVFKEKLNAKTLFDGKKGHFTISDDVMELPIVLEELLAMSA